MSTTSRITPNLPEFPYSPASDARRHLGSLLSSSHFVTTVVSPPAPAPHRPPSAPQSLDLQDNADPSHPPPPQADSLSAEISTHPSESSQPPAGPSIPSVPFETARLPAPACSDSRPVGIETARLKSSNPRQIPSQAYSFKQSSVLVGTGQGCVTRPSPRSRSAWHRFKRMGNRFVTPLRSMGLCFTSCTGGRRAVAFCEDFSGHDTSPGSSWYSSGEYPPEFIRAVLENNALLGTLAV